MSDTIKRKRSINFTNSEKELLLKIAIPWNTVLENKTSNAITWKIKEDTWEEITTQYNGQTVGTPRSASCLKQKYENIKKKIRLTKNQLSVTDFGQCQKYLTKLESELLKTMEVSAEETQSTLNADADIKPTLENICYALTKDDNLTEEKKSLMCLQKELVKQELEQSRKLYQLKTKHLNEEHNLRMIVLQYECNI